MDNQAPQLADGQLREQALRDGGFTDDEVNQWKGQTAQTLTQGGFSSQEVRDYFGQKEPNMAGVKAQVQKNMVANAPQGEAQKREPIDTSIKPVEAKDIWDAMAAGWGNSILGLMTSGKRSPIQVPENASVAQSFASNLTQMAGDSPAMGAGFLGGAAAGGAAGTATVPILGTISGAAVGGAAGAFAVPSGIRRALVDHYKANEGEDPGNFARRLVGVTWDAAKGAVTGLASEVTGGVGGALMGTAGKLTAEVAAQTVVSSALEGHMPTKRDFINGAVAIGGLHAIGFGVGKSGYISDKLMNIYSETGAHPAEILEAANNDPALKGELLSQNPNLPKEAAPPSVPSEEPPITKPEEGSGPTPEEDNARQEILSRIGEQSAPEKLTLKEKISDELNGLYSKHLDYTKVVGDVLEQIGDQPLDENNARVLMRLHAAVADKTKEFIEYGTRDFNTGETNGESFTKILDDYKSDTGETNLEGLKAYGIAARSLELEKRGIEQPGSRENDQAFVDKNPQLKPFFGRVVDYNNRVLDYLGDSGRYSKEQIGAMKDLNQNYISFRKIIEADELTGKTPATSKEIKKIGNSDSQFQDPILSTIQNTDRMIKLAHETEAANVFIDQMSKSDTPEDFYRVSEKQTGLPAKTQIAGYVDGERTLYDVPEEVADSVKRMAGNKPAMNVFTGLLKPFASLLRLGTVNNPLFALRHAWRNQMTGPTLTQTGLKPFEALLYAPEFLAKGESYHNFVYDGGGVNSLLNFDKSYVDGKIYELNKEAPFIDKAWNTVKSASEFSHWGIVMNDNIIRFAEYKRMLEKGATRSESAFAAREVLPDFQKQGLQRSALQSITAFLNVHLQGQSRMFQEMGDNPYGYVAKNLAYITVPSMLLAAAQSDDDAIKDLPNWQKYNYWNIHMSGWRDANSLAEAMSVKSAYPSNVRQNPDGKYEVNDGTIVRIQKPFTNGIFFGSFMEASLDAWRKKDPGAFKDFVKNVGGSVAVEPIPTAATPLIENWANKSFYTGQAIVRQSMENKLPEMQYDRFTSETAKTIAKLVSYVPGGNSTWFASPARVESFIHGWGGTMGSYVVDAVDSSLRAAGVSPAVVKPTDTLADIPFVREFVVRFPNARPQSVSDFEDRYKTSDQVFHSVQQLMKEGNVTAAIKLQDRYSVNMDRLRGVDVGIQNINATIQKTYQDPGIDPTQKRQLIDMMMYQMTSMAKQGNMLMDEFEKRAKNKTGS